MAIKSPDFDKFKHWLDLIIYKNGILLSTLLRVTKEVKFIFSRGVYVVLIQHLKLTGSGLIS